MNAIRHFPPRLRIVARGTPPAPAAFKPGDSVVAKLADGYHHHGTIECVMGRNVEGAWQYRVYVGSGCRIVAEPAMTRRSGGGYPEDAA